MSSYSVTRRAIRFLILTVILCSILPPLIYHREVVQAYFGWSPLPPLYEKYREREQHLEHYKEYEQRSNVKYIWQENHQHSPYRLFPSIDHVFTLHRRGVGERDARRYYECADCACCGALVSRPHFAFNISDSISLTQLCLWRLRMESRRFTIHEL